MVKLQNFINNLTKSNVNNENILINILASVMIQTNKYNINEVKDRYNIEDIIEIDSDILSQLLECKNIINYLSINYNFKNLNIKIEENRKYINYIINSTDIINKNILLLSSSYGEFNSIFKNPDANFNIDIYDLFEDNIRISQMDYDISYSKSFKFKCQDYLHKNVITKNYDLILCNFPSGLKNIIHAECCDKIKQLKIRGTKSEPLILQLIMTSLKKNGQAILIVPNTLLNNESVQHIKTRELLINNFNVTRIINLNNTSILYFQNTGKTKKIIFEQFNTETEETKTLFEINHDKIITKNYNLYYEKYNNNIEDNYITSNKYKLKDIADVITSELNDNNNLLIPMNYDNNQKIIFHKKDIKLNDFYTIKITNSMILQKYFNYYFYYVVGPYISSYTTGKLKKLDINNLLEIYIQIPNLDVQNNIIDYYDKLNEQSNKNTEIINNINELKSKYIDLMINSSDLIQLKYICNIDTKPNYTTKYCIHRNSKSAGFIYRYDTKDANNTNVYFINDIKDFEPECLYIILKHNEIKLNKLASITNTINLSKNCLENFEIKNVSINIQNKIIEQYNLYETLSNQIIDNTNRLVNENLFKCICNF